MKKLLVALAALALSTSAFAQTAGAAASGNGGQFGIGVTISPSLEILVPIKVAPNIRVEPTIAISTQDTEGTDTSDLTLGAGVFVQQRVAAPVEMYAGGRIRLNFASVDDGVNDDSGTDFEVSAAVGGEYYLVPKFSLGLEANLGFYSDSEVSGDDSGFFTRGFGLLRLYF